MRGRTGGGKRIPSVPAHRTHAPEDDYGASRPPRAQVGPSTAPDARRAQNGETGLMDSFATLGSSTWMGLRITCQGKKFRIFTFSRTRQRSKGDEKGDGRGLHVGRDQRRAGPRASPVAHPHAATRRRRGLPTAPTRASPDGARRLSLPRLVLRLPGKPSSNSPYFGGNLSPGLGHAPHLPSLPKASPRPPQATTALALGLSSPQGPAEASLRSHRAASVSPLASVRLTCRLYRVGDMVPT